MRSLWTSLVVALLALPAPGLADEPPKRRVASSLHFALGGGPMTLIRTFDDVDVRLGARLVAEAAVVPYWVDVSLRIGVAQSAAPIEVLFQVPIPVHDVVVPWLGIGGALTIRFDDDRSADAGGAGGLGLDLRLTEDFALRIEGVAHVYAVPELDFAVTAGASFLARL